MGMGKPAFCQFICPAGTLEGGIPLLSTHQELRQTIGKLFSLKMFILVATIILCILIYRFFCKVMCPLGAIYGLLNKASIYHLEVDKHKCVGCGKCKKICKMDVDPVEKPDSAECIRCGACVHECPKDAIYLGFKTCSRKTVPCKEKIYKNPLLCILLLHKQQGLVLFVNEYYRYAVCYSILKNIATVS